MTMELVLNATGLNMGTEFSIMGLLASRLMHGWVARLAVGAYAVVAPLI